MKRVFGFAIAAVIAFAALSAGESRASDKAINWKLVSKNLVRSLASDNEGLRQSAMHFFIENADKLDIDRAMFDVMRVYHHHSELRMRKLALVTLYKMQNKRVIEFLKTDLRFENSEQLKHMIAAIVQEFAAKKAS